MPHPTSTRDTASFRDPTGFVLERDGRVFRAYDQAFAEVLRALEAEGLLGRLVSEGRLVGTERVADPALARELDQEHHGRAGFLEHRRLWPITYPYEWSISMVADAGIATLDLQLHLLEHGFSLKDASAYNVQFDRGRPLFIDVASIERPARLDLWFALGQFQQMFTFPLLLAGRGWDARSYFLGSLGGQSVTQIVRGLGPLERWRPRYLLDATLPALLGARAEGKPGGPGREILERPNQDPKPQTVNLRRLRAKLGKLAAAWRPAGAWAGYAETCSYGAEAETAKKALVEAFLERARPATVLDLGCNTGDYSRLAAGKGARVIAADADHDAVEILYRRLRKEPADISPMVVDLASPSPAVGFRNRERPSFGERIQADCVLALALVHHLHVVANLPMEAIRDLLLSLTRRDLVLEFVPREDPMFRRLMRFRADLYGDFSLEACRRVFEERFELVAEQPIPSSPRTLLVMRARARANE